MSCTSFLCVDAELLRLFGRLSTRPCDDEYVLEAVLVERGTGEADGLLALLVREVLCLAVAALN